VTAAELLALADRFNHAWNTHDLEAALALVSDDCVFETTAPAPDGERHQGREALRAAWKPVFDNPDSHFDFEELLVAGDRLAQRWRYSWGSGHVRGVDLLRVRDGRIAEKLSYVKG
jgi:uncharacterized protein (TIGR02246 family)